MKNLFLFAMVLFFPVSAYALSHEVKVSSGTGVPDGFPSIIYTATQTATVSNSSAETNLFSIGLGTSTLNPGFFSPGKTLRIRGSGVYSTTTTAPGTLNIQVKLGGTTISSTTATSLQTSQLNQPWVLSYTLTCLSSGASGTVIGNNFFAIYNTSTTIEAWPMTMAATKTIDTTASLSVSVTATFSVASSSNSITQSNLQIRH